MKIHSLQKQADEVYRQHENAVADPVHNAVQPAEPERRDKHEKDDILVLLQLERPRKRQKSVNDARAVQRVHRNEIEHTQTDRHARNDEQKLRQRPQERIRHVHAHHKIQAVRDKGGDKVGYRTGKRSQRHAPASVPEIGDIDRHRTRPAEAEQQQAQETANLLNGKTVKATAKAGNGGRLFGAITAGNIADLIAQQYGCKVDKKRISLKSDIKNFGTYEAEIRLYAGILAKVTVEVGEA